MVGSISGLDAVTRPEASSRRSRHMSRAEPCGNTAVSKNFKYLNLANLYHLTEGLTFKIPECAGVLDSALVSLNGQTKVPDKICAWNSKDPASRPPLSFPGRGRLIIDVTQAYSKEKGMLYLAQVVEKKDEKETAPIVFFVMRSPTLDIPMRLEVPLRALLKGSANLRGTHSVYLHALLADDGSEFVYYGLTKRGWNNRFNEHMESALRDDSRRLFPSKLRELIEARAAQISGQASDGPKLQGVITAVCAVGLDESQAMDTEEYLVDKYSLSSKHINGLNMIPGGHEGIRALRRLSLTSDRPLIETEDREAVLDRYLQNHPQLGKPKPGVAEKWNDPAYAEAVICARENRLSADQVREIRYLAALGHSVDQIRVQVGALDNGQASRVLAGRTYARIR
jgi:hypothetical protein